MLSISSVDRLHPLSGILREVVSGHGAALLRGGFENGLCDGSFVEGVFAMVGDQAQRVREFGIEE